MLKFHLRCLPHPTVSVHLSHQTLYNPKSELWHHWYTQLLHQPYFHSHWNVLPYNFLQRMFPWKYSQQYHQLFPWFLLYCLFLYNWPCSSQCFHLLHSLRRYLRLNCFPLLSQNHFVSHRMWCAKFYVRFQHSRPHLLSHFPTIQLCVLKPALPYHFRSYKTLYEHRQRFHLHKNLYTINPKPLSMILCRPPHVPRLL